MKVCHVTSAHPPEDGRIFRRACVSLARAGYEVFLVEQGESYEKNGVHIIGFGDIPRSRLKRMTQGVKLAISVAEEVDADIYHLHDPELLQAALKLKRRGKKVIFDSHELYRAQIAHKPYLPGWAAQIVSKCYTLYEDYVLKRIDGVIFPCPIKGQFPLPGKHTAYVNNVPWLDEFYNKYTGEKKEKPIDLCMVGTLSRDRGIKEMILAAFKAGCVIHFAGKFDEEAFEKEIMTMPESKNAVFHGYLNRDQVFDLLESSKIGIATLLNVGQYNVGENLPTKVYEYMAMGVSVILSKAPYNEQIIKEFQFGAVVDPENVDKFADEIRNMLDDYDLLRKMGSNARKAVNEYFNWDLEQNNLLKLYSAIIEE